MKKPKKAYGMGLKLLNQEIIHTDVFLAVGSGGRVVGGNKDFNSPLQEIFTLRNLSNEFQFQFDKKTF